MPKVAHFNPFLVLEPRKTKTPTRSWWLQTSAAEDRSSWVTRAAEEAPRMNKAPEARALNPRCLDDLKII